MKTLIKSAIIALALSIVRRRSIYPLWRKASLREIASLKGYLMIWKK